MFKFPTSRAARAKRYGTHKYPLFGTDAKATKWEAQRVVLQAQAYADYCDRKGITAVAVYPKGLARGSSAARTATLVIQSRHLGTYAWDPVFEEFHDEEPV